MFNAYLFIEDLKNDIKENHLNSEIIHDFIHEYIDGQCVYYSDCFDICKTLNFTDFKHDIFGICENISQAAYCALYDLVYIENSDILDLCNIFDNE